MGDLRKGVLLGANKRQEIIYNYKIKAASSLWKEVYRLSPLKHLETYLMTIDIDEFLKVHFNNPNSRKLIESFGKVSNVDMETLSKEKKLFLERPYLSERLWSLYLICSSITVIVITITVITKYHSLKSGKEEIKELKVEGRIIKVISKKRF